MVGNYERLGLTVRDILSEFNWNILYFMFHNHGKDTGRGNSDCSFTLSAVHRHVGKKETYMDAFDEEISSRVDYLRILTKAKTQSRSECIKSEAARNGQCYFGVFWVFTLGLVEQKIIQLI